MCHYGWGMVKGHKKSVGLNVKIPERTITRNILMKLYYSFFERRL